MNRRAFTLIEILMVIAIIAILAAMTMGGVMYVRQAQKSTSTRQIFALMTTALEAIKEKRGAYPDSIDRKIWIAAVVSEGELKLRDGDLLDGWEQPIEYRIPRRYDGTYDGKAYDFTKSPIPRPDSFWIWSVGANGVADEMTYIDTDGRTTTLPMGGGDDLTNWK